MEYVRDITLFLNLCYWEIYFKQTLYNNIRMCDSIVNFQLPFKLYNPYLNCQIKMY